MVLPITPAIEPNAMSLKASVPWSLDFSLTGFEGILSVLLVKDVILPSAASVIDGTASYRARVLGRQRQMAVLENIERPCGVIDRASRLYVVAID